jgi:HD-GYP domain-containing protein (c-di-GMP phosphodiesterase class II)
VLQRADAAEPERPPTADADGVGAAARAVVDGAARIAPGLRCSVVAGYGPNGAWRVLASADPEREAVFLASRALAQLAPDPDRVETLDDRSWAIALLTESGALAGCVLFAADYDRVLPPSGITNLLTLARTASQILEKARVAQRVGLSDRYDAALRGLPRLMLAATGRDEMLAIFGSTIEHALPGCSWRLLLRRASDGPMLLAGASVGSTIDSEAARAALRAINADRVLTDFPARGRVLTAADRVTVAAPVHDQRMRRIGAVVVDAPIGCGIEHDTQADIIGSLCGSLSLSLELDARTRTQRLLQRLDPDTGCISPEVLREATAVACDRCLRENGTAALLAIQLESGTVGASAATATRIGDALAGLGRDYDLDLVVARIRPWQFVVLADQTTRRNAMLLATRARWHLRSAIAGMENCSSSVGIAMIPQHGSTFGLLMDAARTALDDALAEGNCERVASGDPRKPPALVTAADTGARLEMLESIAELIDDLFFRGTPHSEAVAQRAREIALRLGVPHDLLQFVTLAGKLHDVGRALLAPSVFALAAPTPEQRRLIQTHVVLGARLVDNAGFPKAASCIGALHERWDGSGQPHGLRHTEIPLGARIIAVANTFETVLNGLGRGDHGAAAAFATIQRERDHGLDPTIVDALLSSLNQPTRDETDPDLLAG